MLQLCKAPAAQRVKIHPLVIRKSTTTPGSATVLEFTLTGLDGEGERTDDEGMSWCARELGQVVSLASPCMPPGSGARPRAASLFPTPPSRSSIRALPSRMSNPLPTILGLHSQLDRLSRIGATSPSSRNHGTSRAQVAQDHRLQRYQYQYQTMSIAAELSPSRIPETPMSAYSWPTIRPCRTHHRLHHPTLSLTLLLPP
jgi:hypothetical protein